MKPVNACKEMPKIVEKRLETMVRTPTYIVLKNEGLSIVPEHKISSAKMSGIFLDVVESEMNLREIPPENRAEILFMTAFKLGTHHDLTA
jgi:hypothetical protein